MSLKRVQTSLLCQMAWYKLDLCRHNHPEKPTVSMSTRYIGVISNFAHRFMFAIEVPAPIVVVATGSSVPIAAFIVVGKVAVLVIFVGRLTASVRACCRGWRVFWSCGWRW